MIILAAFYKDLKTDSESSIVNESVKGFDYKAALGCLKQTFEKKTLNGKFLITTDKETYLEFNASEIFRSNLGTAGLMESLVKSNTDVIKSFTGKIILCGSDHLINGDLNNFFIEDFDIGILYNGDSVNNTVVLVNIQDHNRSAIIDFFEQREQTYYNLPQTQRDWLGDQLSYQLLLNKHNIFNNDAPLTKIYQGKNLKFKIMKYGENEVSGCRKGRPQYNKQAMFLDFKGIRKQWFYEIYKNIINEKT